MAGTTGRGSEPLSAVLRTTPPSPVSEMDVDGLGMSLSGVKITPTSRNKGKLSRKKLNFANAASPEFSIPSASASSEQGVSHATEHRSMPQWSDLELQYLVEFVVLHTDGQSWPVHNNPLFWKNAGKFIQARLNTLYCRTGEFIARACMHGYEGQAILQVVLAGLK